MLPDFIWTTSRPRLLYHGQHPSPLVGGSFSLVPFSNAAANMRAFSSSVPHSARASPSQVGTPNARLAIPAERRLRMRCRQCMSDVAGAQCCCSGELRFDLVIVLSDSQVLHARLRSISKSKKYSARNNKLNAALRIGLVSLCRSERKTVDQRVYFFDLFDRSNSHFFAVASNVGRLSRVKYPYGCHFRTVRRRQPCRACILHSEFVLPSRWKLSGRRRCRLLVSRACTVVEDGVAGFQVRGVSFSRMD